MPKYSLIIPVFKREDEVDEFLQSIEQQEFKDFEVLMVDGSPDRVLHPVIDKYKERVPLKYFYEKGLPASESRNLGCENAKGEYLVFIDSDCIVPKEYLTKIDDFVLKNDPDAFGGPDAAHKSFSKTLKAVNYAMTSMLTTGGIRGKKTHVGKFQLRGFNMAIKKDVFFKVGGFSGMQVAEDIELSIRLNKSGFTTFLIPEAHVYHKRRANFIKFFKQLFMHGKGRIDLYLRHKDSLKLLHLLPLGFDLYLIGTVVIVFVFPIIALYSGTLLVVYILAILIDSTIQNKSIIVGFMSILSSLILLTSYGMGLFYNFVKRIVFGVKDESIKSVELKL